MILLISAVLGLAAGLVAGGSFKRAKHYELRGLALPVAALLIKAGAAYLLPPQKGAVIVCLIQYLLIFLFLFLNIKRPIWPAAALLGTAGNFLVILLNGGCMPVSASLVRDSAQRLEQLANGEIYAYCLMDADTKLSFLGDVLRLGPAGAPLGFASAGDLALCAGVAILCFQMMRAKAE